MGCFSVMMPTLLTGVAQRSVRLLSSIRSKSSKPLRVAFLGAGDISNLHAEAINRTPSAELTGIWSLPGCAVVTDPAAVARSYNTKLYDSTDQLISDPDVDAVFVLTNMETHAELAISAMNQGKHVLVEKPVASSVAELESMKAAAEANGVVCMPGHNYIYEPWFDRTHQLIRSGELGEITALYVMYNIHHPDNIFSRDSIQGVIRQIGTHLAYMTVYLMGQPVEVSAMKASIDTQVLNKENIVMANMTMANGGIAHLEASFAADDHGSDPWSVYLKVIGTKGSARYSYNDWVVNARHPGGAHSHSYVPYPHTVHNECAYFIEEVLERGGAPLSTLDDAITCQRIIEGIEKSILEKRHVDIMNP